MTSNLETVNPFKLAVLVLELWFKSQNPKLKRCLHVVVHYKMSEQLYCK